MCEETEMKKCTKCEEVLPNTKEYFCIKNSKKETLDSFCKVCKKKINEERKLKNKNNPQEKECSICHQNLNKRKYFHIDKYKEDGYSDICIECENINAKLKICSKCNRAFPSTLSYYHKDKTTIDGLTYTCKECRTGKEIFDKIKPKEGYKFCIKCNRELLSDIKYFPPDKDCIDGLRNVCRECGKDGHFMEEGYIPKEWWSKEEDKLFKERYPNFTNKELIEKFYPNCTEKDLWDKAYRMNFTGKTEETKKRANEHKSKILSIMFKGKIVSEETRRKLSETRKRQYSTGEFISPWKGRIVSKAERKQISERKRGVWAGEKNPRVSNPLVGELNGRWKGGIKPLYFYLRDFIKQWKNDSMKANNYKCALTGLEFDNIHHLTPFRDIVDEVFNITKLDIKQSIGDYSETELKILQNKLLELHEFYGLGVTLSKTIHKLFHDTYGYTKVTPNDFEEFKARYYYGKYDELLEDKYKSYNSIERLKKQVS